MSRSLVFLMGLLVFAVAAGSFYFRLSSDPSATRRYDWALERLNVRKDASRSDTERSAPSVRTYSRGERADRRTAWRQRNQQQDRLELFKLGLDLANVVVGLIGIFLALTSVRGNRQTAKQS